MIVSILYYWSALIIVINTWNLFTLPFSTFTLVTTILFSVIFLIVADLRARNKEQLEKNATR